MSSGFCVLRRSTAGVPLWLEVTAATILIQPRPECCSNTHDIQSYLGSGFSHTTTAAFTPAPAIPAAEDDIMSLSLSLPLLLLSFSLPHSYHAPAW
ncbi:unnamed protein product [Schistocephalus solidus]|uniref:Secreted protein n=1 Tax=Schistocephalus solidus TaxID=70667 RepID=A0A183TRS0_SCHSO|nr:unnamed protein product [Schistocephalus solidus]